MIYLFAIFSEWFSIFVHNPEHRSPLALWMSFGGMKTWPYQRVLILQSGDGAKGMINYPDSFVSEDKRSLHFAMMTTGTVLSTPALIYLNLPPYRWNTTSFV